MPGSAIIKHPFQGANSDERKVTSVGKSFPKRISTLGYLQKYSHPVWILDTQLAQIFFYVSNWAMHKIFVGWVIEDYDQPFQGYYHP